jgi:FAD/FMN-containing dehydrogenase
MAMSNLTHMSVSADKKTLSVGPGYRFSDVYPYLQQYGLTVGGARLGPVGVPGILLAGGINSYGNQFGFSADQVKRYEVVLANGEIVEATEKKNADLFWALKGGSSNFGVVTRFDMKTIPSKKVWAGIYTVAQQYLPQFLEVQSSLPLSPHSSSTR